MKFRRILSVLTVVALLSLLFTCRMNTVFLPASPAGLPADIVEDASRSQAASFAFDTLLPVALELQVDLYAYGSQPGSDSLESLPASAGAVFANLRDSEGNQVYSGKRGPDGKLQAQLQLPAAPRDATLTLQAEGFETRKVLIQDMSRYSLVKRRMGLLRQDLQAKGSGLVDSDADGVPDIYDVASLDPNYAFSTQVPADGWLSIAFEDLFLQAQAGDADYNDFIGRYRVEVLSDGENRITAYKVTAWADVKLAGYNHLFGIHFDSFRGEAKLNVTYYDKLGQQMAAVPEVRFREKANVILFPSTKDSVGKRTEFTLSFLTPQAPLEVVQPPFNPYILVYNTGYDIHLIDRPALPLSRNFGSSFRDSEGFPWALMVPSADKWKHPAETQRIEIPYPRFTLWRQSWGDEHVDWYLHYYDPYVPPAEKNVSRAADLNPGAGSSSPAGLTAFGGKLYFSANDGSSGTELWSFDGTSAIRAADIRSGSLSSNPRYPAVFGTALYFQANDGAATGLWRHDGSSTARVTALNLPIYMTVFNSQLFMGAYDLLANGEELWRYDGTNAFLVQDLNPGGNGGFPTHLTEFGSNLYFQADNGNTGRELYRCDGSSISLAADIVSGAAGSTPSFLTVFGANLYFQASDSYGAELWRFGGASAVRLTDLNPAGDSLLSQSGFAVFNNALYFCADDGATGVELWKYDGVTASRVTDINPGAGDGLTQPAYLAVYNNRLYFGADNGTNGTELWSFDGSTAQIVQDINPSGASNPKEFRVFGGRLYFSADDGSTGAELWVLY